MTYFFNICLIVSLTCVVLKAEGDEIPIVITTWGSKGFSEATKRAVEATKTGGRMYGLVEGLSTCEDLQCDTTVGYGGSPDEKGETTLDSMVIDSEGMQIGSVANLHRIRNAAKVAWAVMNFTRHTLIVGESATAFAKSMGFVEQDLKTDVSEKMHQDWLAKSCQPNYWINVSPDPTNKCGPYTPNKSSQFFTSNEPNQVINENNHDTIGMVVIDSEKKVSAGTSSNGARNKIPGRVGDSPIPGAGAYATSVGGAAATGDGDVMMRFLPSFYIVQQLEIGTKPSKAVVKAIRRIIAHYPKFQGGVVALDTKGRFGAACANIDRFSYSLGYQNGTVVTRKLGCLKDSPTTAKPGKF